MARQRRPFDTWDVLKVVAMLLMFVDHGTHFFLDDTPAAYYLRAIGRGAAPIFFFLAGYARSYRFSRELFVLAVLLTVFEWLYFWKINTLNVLFTIMLSRAIFQWFEQRGRVIKRPVEWYIGACALFVLEALTEYGPLGFLIALTGYMRRHEAAYSSRLRYGLSGVIFLSYASFQVAFFDPAISPVVGFAVMGLVMAWCMRFSLHEVRAPWLPAWAAHGLKLFSQYSGYIYVLHLAALMVISGKIV